MKKIRVTNTKTQRARNRVKEHGAVFGVLQDIGNSIHPDSICCVCLDPGCRWVGWFSPDEVEFIPYVES